MVSAWIDRIEFDPTTAFRGVGDAGRCATRRAMLRGTLAGLGGIAAFYHAGAGRARAQASAVAGDVAIDARTAMVFSQEAPLVPAPGLRDARAVWCHIPAMPDKSVLVYFHGHNGYVTVDAKGRSRVPDWAAGNEAAKAGASGKDAAPLVYRLDRLDSRGAGKKPIVLVPEISTLSTNSFWAREPAGQYADAARLGLLVADCLTHLQNLHRPDGSRYLSDEFVQSAGPTSPRGPAKLSLDRVFVGGHSGAGLPLEEVAKSALVQPETGVPADLWLFDSTYWSKVEGFVQFCKRWHDAGKLAGGRRDAARFVCIYRPGTSTEEVADDLRAQIGKAIGVEPASLVKQHSPDNLVKEIRPALEQTGVLFLKTDLPHDEIPTVFIPLLLETAANPH